MSKDEKKIIITFKTTVQKRKEVTLIRQEFLELLDMKKDFPKRLREILNASDENIFGFSFFSDDPDVDIDKDYRIEDEKGNIIEDWEN